MRAVSLLGCITLLAACTGEIDSGDPELENLAISNVPTNGIVFFPPALAAFKSNRLATETFDPATGPAELTSLPFDDETRKFLKYTVECALAPNQEVKFQGDVYTGLMGECPSWNIKKPSIACQEAVSGCLLARQNPMDKVVPFSPRGLKADGGFFDANQIALANTYKEDFLGTQVSSLWATCPGTPGELRDCGWNTDTAMTGRCTPGKDVHVGAGAHPLTGCNGALGSAVDGDMVVRACSGMSGCDPTDLTHMASNDNACDRNPAVTITCPDSGVFSVMLSSHRAGDVFEGTVGVESTDFVEFPSLIIDLYTILEASYYGNMLHKINPNVTLRELGPNEGYILQLDKADREHTGFGSPQVFPWEDAWCCHDPDIDPGYLDNGRVCGVQAVLDPDGKPAEANLCVCKSLGPCNTIKKNHRANRCPIYDQAPFFGDIDHDDCRDGLSVGRKWPMTVFLHGACDMVGPGEEGQFCKHK